jgi:hypothetical protein
VGKMLKIVVTIIVSLSPFLAPAAKAAMDDRKKELLNTSATFIANFDDSENANFARGDSRIFTAASMQSLDAASPGINSDALHWVKAGGKHSGALSFKQSSEHVLLFKGSNNINYSAQNFSGSVSLWMKLNPQQDLPEGFVDPIMIYDKAWNDASFFIDFDKEQNRDFRLGVFSDYAFWNPDDIAFDDLASEAKPLYLSEDATFSDQKWIHVAFTWHGINSDSGATVRLYVDGQLSIERKQHYQFTWDTDKVNIIVGLNYVGLLDELVIFDKALSADEIKILLNH